MKPVRIRTQSHSGLTLLEVCVVIAVVALLAAVLFAMLANTNRRSPRIHCTSNLKQVGLAMRIWANANAGEFPQVSTNASGSFAWVNSPEVFRHFVAMSNELVTPKILVCPADAKRKRVTDFAKFSNANLSYFVALDADETKPNRLLSGDRNITGGTLSNGFLRTLTPQTEAGWTTGLHNNAGNIGLSDGSVQQVTPAGLRKQLQAQDLPVIRLAVP